MKKLAITLLVISLLINSMSVSATGICSYCGSYGEEYCQHDAVGYDGNCYDCGSNIVMASHHFYCGNPLCGASYYSGSHPCHCEVCPISFCPY